jgi:hypothetical protein
MKLTVEIEVPDHGVVDGIARQLAPEFARLVALQFPTHSADTIVVVSAYEEESEDDAEYYLAGELEAYWPLPVEDEDEPEDGAVKTEEPTPAEDEVE